MSSSSQSVVLITSNIVDAEIPQPDFPPYRVISVEQGPFSARTLMSLMEGDPTIGLLCGSDEVNSAVLKMGRENGLRYVVKCGVSIDNIDIVEAKRLGIGVAVCPPVHAPAVAELSLAFMFSILRNLVLHDHLARTKNAVSYVWREGDLLGGKTVLIMGFGQVGRLVALRLLGLGARVIIVQPRWNEVRDAQLNELRDIAASLSRVSFSAGFWSPQIERMESLDQALPQADIVSLHVSPVAANRNLVDDGFWGKCKPKVVLINTAWGPLIDEKALLQASRMGILGGFGSDLVSSLSPNIPELQFVQSDPVEGILDVSVHRMFGGIVAMAEWVVEETLRSLQFSMKLPGAQMVIPRQVRREMNNVARKLQRTIGPETTECLGNIICTGRIGYRAAGIPLQLARHAMQVMRQALDGAVESVQWVVAPKVSAVKKDA